MITDIARRFLIVFVPLCFLFGFALSSATADVILGYRARVQVCQAGKCQTFQSYRLMNHFPCQAALAELEERFEGLTSKDCVPERGPERA